MENIENKNKNSMTAGGMTSSRDALWNDRISEFNSSPIFGIGFASIATERNNQHLYESDGKVETGSSWLNILSMIGILGLTIYIFLILKALYLLYKNIKLNLKISSYLISLLIFWLFHMIAEGYVLASGSVLFFLSWLLIGFIYILNYNSKYINLISIYL